MWSYDDIHHAEGNVFTILARLEWLVVAVRGRYGQCCDGIFVRLEDVVWCSFKHVGTIQQRQMTQMNALGSCCLPVVTLFMILYIANRLVASRSVVYLIEWRAQNALL